MVGVPHLIFWLKHYKMKVHLRKRKLRNSTKSNIRYTLYLDIYHYKGKRKREFLGIYIEPQDTQTIRKEKLGLAHQIKAKRMLELTNEEFGFPSKDKLKMNFLDYYKSQMEKKKGNTKMIWKNVYLYLDFYTCGNIPFKNVDKKWLEDFTDFILTKVSVASAYTYMGKIRATLNEAVRDGIILNSPGNLTRPLKVPEKSKEHLTVEEIQKIANTPFYNDEVKRAFLFSCFTGLRLCDLRKLKYGDIKETSFNGNGIKYVISIQQSKTKNITTIPLNETAFNLIKPMQNNDCLVFHLSKHHISTQRALNRLLEAAEISSKHITFHCARHSNAVMLLANGANLMTVKELLGHRDIKSTQVYAKVVDASKHKAVTDLPTIEL